MSKNQAGYGTDNLAKSALVDIVNDMKLDQMNEEEARAYQALQAQAQKDK